MEKINLPTSDDIAQEKELIETETQANKEVFQKTILKTLESFDATELKHVETHETTIQEKSFKEGYTQEKTHQNLLNEIEMLDEVKLAPVKTIEPMSATELAKSELSRNVVLQVHNIQKYFIIFFKFLFTKEKRLYIYIFLKLQIGFIYYHTIYFFLIKGGQ